MMEIRHLPLEAIKYRTDARKRSDHVLAELEASIAAIGLINPVRVRAVGDGYEVIAGAHRVQALDLLGWREVPCIVVTDDDLHAELTMIDENLCRSELSASDRAVQTARRKAIYLELHPETAHGANLEGAGVAKSATPETPAFSRATAKVTGQSERTVRLDAERGEKVISEVMDLIRGTKLDTGVYLDKIKRLPPNEQLTAAKRDLSISRQQAQALQERKTGSLATRTEPAETSSPAPAVLPRFFERFISLVDEIEALPIPELLIAAGRQRSVLGQRASGLADRMGKIMEALDQ